MWAREGGNPGQNVRDWWHGVKAPVSILDSRTTRRAGIGGSISDAANSLQTRLQGVGNLICSQPTRSPKMRCRCGATVQLGQSPISMACADGLQNMRQWARDGMRELVHFASRRQRRPSADARADQGERVGRRLWDGPRHACRSRGKRRLWRVRADRGTRKRGLRPRSPFSNRPGCSAFT